MMAKNAKCATALPDFHFLAKIVILKKSMLKWLGEVSFEILELGLVLLGNESFGILKLGDFWYAKIVLGEVRFGILELG